MDALRLTDGQDLRLDLAADGLPLDEDDGRAPAPPRLLLEAVDLHAIVSHQAAWADLCSRALEPNVFLEPAFCLPLVQHLRPDRRPLFLLAWEEDGPATFGRLVGLFPLSPPKVRVDPLVRGFASRQTCLGVPLLDRDRAHEIWTDILAWLAARDGRPALVLSTLPKQGAFFRTLVEPMLGARAQIVDEHRRAVLDGTARGRGSSVTCFLSAKRRKELRRQARRLAELGVRTYSSARTPTEIRRATECFLALEHASWKGTHGSALLADPALATFTRTMTRLMAQEGKCRIDSLEVEGRAVAMGIILTVGARAYFWKTAFDERFAALSPGVQLAQAITDTQVSDRDVDITDSCAAPDHPMIDRLWPDRMSVVDVILRLREDGMRGARRFEAASALERGLRRIRRAAKTLVISVRSGALRVRQLDRTTAWSNSGNGSTSSSGSPEW